MKTTTIKTKPHNHTIYLDNPLLYTHEGLKKKKSIKMFIAKHFLKISLIICLLIIGSHFIVEAYQSAKVKFEDYKIGLIEKLTRTQIIKEYVKPESLSTDELISVISREVNLKPVILKVIVIKESHDDINQLYRFEAKQFAKRANLDRKYTEAERRMMSSSHGVTHVMGYRAHECGLHWSQLYEKRNALMCTSVIVKKDLARASKMTKSKSEQLYLAYKFYNGSDQYAIEAMAELGKILFNELI